MVPWKGAIVVYYGWAGRVTTNLAGKKMWREKKNALSFLQTFHKNWYFAIWGLWWYNFFLVEAPSRMGQCRSHQGWVVQS